eukprot:GHVP01029493.1.p1 GENE.GHVP01029493.1~~GHVP01029493.1.p1  ORF type:complete len:310 (+),score=51.82 GHVP01029493.1:31-930(+)
MEVKGLVDQINSAFTDFSLPQRSELTFGEELIQERIAIEAEPQFHVVSRGVTTHTKTGFKYSWWSFLPQWKEIDLECLEVNLYLKIQRIAQLSDLSFQILSSGTINNCLPKYNFGETNFYFTDPLFHKGRIYFYIGVNCSLKGTGLQKEGVPDKEKDKDHLLFEVTWKKTPTKEILKELFTTCVYLSNPSWRYLEKITRKGKEMYNSVCPDFERLYKVYEKQKLEEKDDKQHTALRQLLGSYMTLQPEHLRNQELALKGLVERRRRTYKKLKCSLPPQIPMSEIREDSHEESMDDADSY